ncbi:toll/interleukin-1 receptor domain-containing protein [Frigidibacter sp.]|uniref:toll/interleukin-1 receptor domain-containing protein n=1 Tax=Frigidibacter sp. TaxID=2586418 RepID=UPI002735C284|nr:toll/interleukin-1 receptor domain-containing protein [Frigidibacter sp.]MDP3338783.1 toll/interleukin-1 receptor domain-containing protein [Frigidibacter sp.]
MAIFISYSHQDSEFVDTLAANLVRAKHHVWMDRWELNVGDSLTAKIEGILTESSAILVILSKSSVESNWCKRELTAGLVRELEENKTLVLPVVIDDCKIPIFLRDKLYADFRVDPDKAFDLVDRSLARISNPTLSRFEGPDFHTDYSIDWKRAGDQEIEGSWIIRLTFVDHSENFPYVVVSELKVYEISSQGQFERALVAGKALKFAKQLLGAVTADLERNPMTGVLSDNFPQHVVSKVEPPGLGKYLLIYNYRRLGEDNGMDTVVYLDNNLHVAFKHLQATVPS